MATGLINGTDLLLKVGADGTEAIIAASTSCSLEVSMDEIDQTNKDSLGWKSIIGGTRSWSVSADALYQNEDVANTSFVDLWSYVNTRSKIFVEFTVEGGSAGDDNVYYEGSGFITSLSVNGGTEDQSSFSVTITGSGALVEDTFA
tara:strand:+ start:660 stop:1097 length:438 start_codon:yes stop_codon:yes gene_type:complete